MITILDISQAAKVRERSGTIHMADFAALNLPLFPRCANCGSELTIQNAYPSRSGEIRCDSCIGNSGFPVLADYNNFVAAGGSNQKRNLL